MEDGKKDREEKKRGEEEAEALEGWNNCGKCKAEVNKKDNVVSM